MKRGRKKPAMKIKVNKRTPRSENHKRLWNQIASQVIKRSSRPCRMCGGWWVESGCCFEEDGSQQEGYSARWAEAKEARFTLASVPGSITLMCRDVMAS